MRRASEPSGGDIWGNPAWKLRLFQLTASNPEEEEYFRRLANKKAEEECDEYARSNPPEWERLRVYRERKAE